MFTRNYSKSLADISLLLCVTCLLLMMLTHAYGQVYPARPVRMLVGFTPGSGADATARAVAQKLSQLFGQPFVIENRVGASATLATERVAAAQADGYTLLVLTGAEPPQPALGRRLPYDLKRDIAPVSMLASGPLLLVVNSALPARSISELVALANVRDGKLNCGSAGVGTATHFAQVLFNLKAKIKTVHVPFRGAPESAAATAAGEIDMSFPGLPAALPLVQSGKLRALAVTSARRASLMASVPTMREAGFSDYEMVSWYGIAVPAGVAASIISRLNSAIDQVVNTPAMKEWLVQQGFEPQTNKPAEFGAFIAREIAQGAELVKAAGLKSE
jgi:tripartite-type tricarboxylate transporter receptor subunit TctC